MAEKEKINWPSVALFVLALIAGILSFVYGEKFIHKNEEAVQVITTVFSIFAGFVIAITTILGTPVSDTEKQSWKTLELRRDNVFKRLARQKWLFIAYTMTLIFIFVSSLLGHIENPPDYVEIISCIVERLYLGMAVFALFLSLGLPSALANIQISRYDELIEEKKKESDNQLKGGT